LVDIRITFEKLLDRIPAESGDNVRLVRPSDLDALVGIAGSSFRDSRFHNDSRFSKSRCDDMFAAWIENACNGYADIVLVAEDAGRPAGFVTCHYGQDQTGSIGLVAVDAAHQGRKLGSQLVRAALRTFREHCMDVTTVATQGRNIRAQNLYQRCGFVSRSVELWYHRWSD
jgi:dTDP-4-amino-4,6-dideoxy-D-galactose acyltransferase